MPLPDSPWERGKCGYKLIQYMACGVPVVASPVGANRQIVRPGLNGFLASTADEWLQVLSALADDPALRQRLGDQGRADVLAHYSLESAAPRLAGWLHEVAAAAR
jgi:glycosyltransferase involved in cell wall biosynthesis